VGEKNLQKKIPIFFVVNKLPDAKRKKEKKKRSAVRCVAPSLVFNIFEKMLRFRHHF
jgi:hypothetical protein